MPYNIPKRFVLSPGIRQARPLVIWCLWLAVPGLFGCSVHRLDYLQVEQQQISTGLQQRAEGRLGDRYPVPSDTPLINQAPYIPDADARAVLPRPVPMHAEAPDRSTSLINRSLHQRDFVQLAANLRGATSLRVDVPVEVANNRLSSLLKEHGIVYQAAYPKGSVCAIEYVITQPLVSRLCLYNTLRATYIVAGPNKGKIDQKVIEFDTDLLSSLESRFQ